MFKVWKKIRRRRLPPKGLKTLKPKNNMSTYKCFQCGQKIKSDDLNKRFVCVECGSRIFYKPRTKMKTVTSD